MTLRALEQTKRDFVRALIETGDLAAAGKAAGLPHPERAIQEPAVLWSFQKALAARLASAAPVALATLTRLMTDKSVPAAVRRMAASDVLDRFGVVAPRNNVAPDGSGTQQYVSEMTPAALRALIGRLESELADKASPARGAVVEHNQPSASNKPLSILD